MNSAAFPENEDECLRLLHELEILDTAMERAYDELTQSRNKRASLNYLL